MNTKIMEFHAPGERKVHRTKPRSERHDLAWQRQQLRNLFSDPAGSPPSAKLTSNIQNATLDRKATRLRLTVRREVLLYRGQGIQKVEETDEDVWIKGAQGWKLKRRATIPELWPFIDFS